jgi:hypothetical protein
VARRFSGSGDCPLPRGAASGKSRLVVFNSDGLPSFEGGAPKLEPGGCPLARLPAWQAPKRDELINIISPVLTQQFGADTLVFGATSERIVSRRDDFYYDATGSPKDDAETAISLVQNKGIQSVRAADFPLPDDAPFRVVKVFFQPSRDTFQ